jgi:hypothetical protein
MVSVSTPGNCRLAPTGQSYRHTALKESDVKGIVRSLRSFRPASPRFRRHDFAALAEIEWRIDGI